MYFPGDPLFDVRPDLQLGPRPEGARSCWSRSFDLGTTEPEWALGFRWDIVLGAAPARRRWTTTDEPLPTTPSQTVGPFFSIGLTGAPRTSSSSPADRRRAASCGRVLDGAGDADPGRDDRGLAGRRARWGRCGTRAATAAFSFVAARPPAPRAGRRRTSRSTSSRAACCKHLVTRIYFPDEAEANAADPVLAGLAEAGRSTLVAEPRRTAACVSTSACRATRETVFFEP